MFTCRVSCCPLSRLHLNLWQCPLSLACPSNHSRAEGFSKEHRCPEGIKCPPLISNSRIMLSHRHSYMLRCEGIGLPTACYLSTYQQNNQRRSSRQKSANKNTAMYAVAIAIAVTGLSYAAVPLYRIFCRASGYGGTVVKAGASEKVEGMEPIRERELTIRYGAAAPTYIPHRVANALKLAYLQAPPTEWYGLAMYTQHPQSSISLSPLAF